MKFLPTKFQKISKAFPHGADANWPHFGHCGEKLHGTGLNIRFLNVLKPNTVGHIGRPMLWKVKHAGWENVREEQVGGEVFPHNWQMTHNQCADAVWN